MTRLWMFALRDHRTRDLLVHVGVSEVISRPRPGPCKEGHIGPLGADLASPGGVMSSSLCTVDGSGSRTPRAHSGRISLVLKKTSDGLSLCLRQYCSVMCILADRLFGKTYS